MTRCPECNAPLILQSGHTGCTTDVCRFMSKVRHDEHAGCWVWMGSIKPNGYGEFYTRSQRWYAHRWAFQHIGGELLLPPLVLDHLCRNHACVNPDHLEQVTNSENIRRGDHSRFSPARSDVCRRGHVWADVGIYWQSGIAVCRACKAEREKRNKARYRREVA